MYPFPECLVSMQNDGAALVNTVTPASLLDKTGLYTVPSGLLIRRGQRWSIKARGRMSTVVTTPGTFTFDLKIGSVVIFSSGALTLNIVAKTNTPFELDIELTLRAVADVANFMGQGKFTSHETIGAPAVGTGGATVQMLPYNAAPAVGSNFDAGAAAVLDLIGTWSVNNAANSIQLHQYDLVGWN